MRTLVLIPPPPCGAHVPLLQFLWAYARRHIAAMKEREHYNMEEGAPPQHSCPSTNMSPQTFRNVASLECVFP